MEEKKGKKSFLSRFKRVKQSKEDANPEYQPNLITDEAKKKEGLSKRIENIDKKLDKLVQPDLKKTSKEFKLPGKINRQLKKLADKGKIMVILLKTNKSVKPIITDIIDGFISIDGVPHNCAMDFVFLWKGKYPCIVLPEWDLNPIGTKDYYQAVEDKRVAAPIAVVMRMIKSGEKLMNQKKPLGAMWIWIGLAAIAFLYILFKPGP